MATRSNVTRRGGDIVRFDPWSDVQDLRRSMDDLWGRFGDLSPSRFFGDWSSPLMGRGAGSPNVELYETQDEVVFSVDLPGFTPEEVDLRVTADAIQLVAQRRETSEESPTTSAPAEQNGNDGNGQNGNGSAPGNGQENGQAANGQSQGYGQTTAVQTSQPRHPRIYHIQNQSRRSFSLSYSLPVEINPDDAQATFKNGVLEVHLPKSERHKPRQVRVPLSTP